MRALKNEPTNLIIPIGGARYRHRHPRHKKRAQIFCFCSSVCRRYFPVDTFILFPSFALCLFILFLFFLFLHMNFHFEPSNRFFFLQLRNTMLQLALLIYVSTPLISASGVSSSAFHERTKFVYEAWAQPWWDDVGVMEKYFEEDGEWCSGFFCVEGMEQVGPHISTLAHPLCISYKFGLLQFHNLTFADQSSSRPIWRNYG